MGSRDCCCGGVLLSAVVAGLIVAGSFGALFCAPQDDIGWNVAGNPIFGINSRYGICGVNRRASFVEVRSLDMPAADVLVSIRNCCASSFQRR